jgi:hypothetical protein
MVSHTRLFQSSAAHWRRLAEQAYKHAANMKTPEARRELMLVAKRYERLSLYAEQLERSPQGSLAAFGAALKS